MTDASARRRPRPSAGQAGCELLRDVQRIPEMNYAYFHFRGPDGRVYGINEQK